MTTELSAIDRFICEANNFETIYYHHRFADKDVLAPRMIVEGKWTCNVEHMIDKWHEACRCADTYWFMYFYCQLDNANKEAMVNWIMENRPTGYIR